MAAAWEQALDALFADLELEAEGLRLAERREQAAELGAAGYAEVTFESRLLASPGSSVDLRLIGGTRVRGKVARAAQGWLLLHDEGGRGWVVPTGAIAVAAGLPAGAVAEEARTVLSRLRIGSVLRTLADERRDCLVHLRTGERVDGAVARVGRDFVELRTPTGPAGVPIDALAAVQDRG